MRSTLLIALTALTISAADAAENASSAGYMLLHCKACLARIIHQLLIICGGCSEKWPIHIANRCVVELLRAINAAPQPP
jgi:hypothetical protein